MAKSGTNVLWVQMVFLAHSMFSYWRGKSYIAMQENEYSSQVDISYLKLNGKSMYIELLVVIVVVVVVTVYFCCCCSCIIVDTHLQMNNNNNNNNTVDMSY